MRQRNLLGTVLLAASVAAAGFAAQAQGFGMGKFSQKNGEAIWKQVCQGCHMPDARGAVGAGYYPALAGDPRLASPVFPVVVLLHGQKGMPDFGGSMLDDEQVAAIVNYVRSNFGNHYKDQVTPAQVAALRGAH
jgi:mono/diheme cytochrome c family protein